MLTKWQPYKEYREYRDYLISKYKSVYFEAINKLNESKEDKFDKKGILKPEYGLTKSEEEAIFYLIKSRSSRR